MKNKKVNIEALNKIYQNAHVALQSISNIAPKIENSNLKSEILEQYDGYSGYIEGISKYMKSNKIEPVDINGFKKLMLWSNINLNTAFDDSKSHIAELMLKGTVMGITDLCSIISNGKTELDEKVLDYATSLKDLEEKYEQNLKQYL